MSQVHPILEKVARAMLADELSHDRRKRVLETVWEDEKEIWLSNARAGVRTLMEPDEGMVQAGESAMIYSVENFIQNQAESVFRAMLLPLLEGEGE